MALIVKRKSGKPIGKPPLTPPDFGAPPTSPPKDWKKKLWFQDRLNRQNPVIDFSPYEINYTRTEKD